MVNVLLRLKLMKLEDSILQQSINSTLLLKLTQFFCDAFESNKQKMVALQDLAEEAGEAAFGAHCSAEIRYRYMDANTC